MTKTKRDKPSKRIIQAARKAKNRRREYETGQNWRDLNRKPNAKRYT